MISGQFYKDDSGVYRAAALDYLSWLDLGFGTRDANNWPPGRAASLHQIHSDRIAFVDGRAGRLGEGDALISRSSGVYLSIRTADCIPVLIADERLRIISSVHAGWRGTASRISQKVIEEMLRLGSKPGDLWAVIGPGICGKCYTVGSEVALQFLQFFPERQDLDSQTVIDLPEANRRQLVAAGIPAERVIAGAPCTLCTPREFHSFRRDGKNAGRMISAVGIRP